MQTLLINLDRSPDRLTEFHRINPHLRNVARFPAVDGRTIDRKKLVKNNIFTEGVANNYSPGAVGCALSHLRVWNTAMESGAPVTAAEDDAIFHSRFDDLAAQTITTLPADWDIIVWGYNFDSVLVHELPGGISVCVDSFIDNKVSQNRQAFQASLLRPNAHKLIACFGTICYSISPNGAKRMTEMAVPLRDFVLPIPGLSSPIGNFGIDIVMNSIYNRINAFVSVPPLVLTPNETGASTVAGS